MAKSSHASKPTLFPVVVVDQQELDMVRVEKSLHSLGFFASVAHREASRTVLQVIRRPDGQRIQAKAVIEGIPSLGLPTTADRDKYMAFMKLALDQREQDGQLSNPVRFTGAELIRLLGLRKGGFHYDEINDWCKRMVATTITSEFSVYLADRRQYVNDIFHVFDRVVLVGEELHDGSRSEYYQVHVSQWQLNNINQNHLLPLDFNAYLKLRRDIAKALFGHLGVWFYATRGQVFSKKYEFLCQLLHIRAYPHLSKAKSVLAPSLDELKEIGYLSDWDLTRTTRGSEFKLTLHPGAKLLALPQITGLVSNSRSASDVRLPDWVPELVRRGVAERKARQLALELAEGQPVMNQIEYADHLLAQDQRKRAKIANPAGFYIWVVEQNLSVPETFETTERRQRLQQQQQTEQREQARLAQLELEYTAFCQDQVQLQFEKEFPADRLVSALQDQLKSLKRAQPAWFERVPESLAREVAVSQLRASVREKLDLPSFDRWCKQQPQPGLF